MTLPLTLSIQISVLKSYLKSLFRIRMQLFTLPMIIFQTPKIKTGNFWTQLKYASLTMSIK